MFLCRHHLTQRVASLDLSIANLSTAELEVLLRAFSVSTTSDCQTVRRTLNIRKSSLAEISLTPRELAEVVVNQLDELNMSGTSPSEEQVTAVLRQILTTTSGRLTSLTIGCNLSLAQVEPALLARAVTRLSQVNLSGCGLSCHQVEAVLEQITGVGGSDRLEVLSLGNNDLSQVDSSLLGRALCRLNKAQIWSCKLNQHQLREIFRIIVRTEDRRLLHLDLEGNDVHQVYPETLGRAVCSLRSVDLHNCKLTLAQVDFIFNQLAEIPPPERSLRSITLTDRQSVNYKDNQSLNLNLDILRGERMFRITKRFLQFHGLNDIKHRRLEDIRRIF